MHGYSTDSEKRRVVPLFLALFAISLAWLSSKLLSVIHFSIPWWADAAGHPHPPCLCDWGAGKDCSLERPSCERYIGCLDV
jgi:hypothetical protein